MRKLQLIFKALSDTNRIRILKMLEVKSLCVCEMTDILKLAPSTVSKHLSILRGAELIIDEKNGKWVNYSLNPNPSEKYLAELLPLLKAWLPNDERIKNDRSKVQTVDRITLCNLDEN